nr:MAG TPA: hypothetical protein [Caudoviricetes sp.]
MGAASLHYKYLNSRVVKIFKKNIYNILQGI